MKSCVFIHTNHKQIVGAHVAERALRRYSRRNEKFDVRFIQLKDHSFFNDREGQLYLRDGMQRPWLNNDLQSFTPLRFMPPELMGYEGRSVVIDPDIFAVSDIWDLLSRDMQGKSIMCRARTGTKGKFDRCLASSVMLLDNARLKHWKVEENFNEMFQGKRDYMNWICLKTESRESIGLLESEWNDFDKLTPETKMLHTTKRKTQPWKTGLPIDHRPREKFPYFPPLAWVMKARRKLFGEYAFLGHYKPHPDPNQQNLFFGLLKECIDEGTVSEEMIREQMNHNHVRHDAFEVLDKTPPLRQLNRGWQVDYCVFIHTNHKQIVGALVAEYALRRNSNNCDKFDVKIIKQNDYPFFQEREGQLYLRDGIKRPWFNEDLQSFTPTRFMPPELMGYQGRAVVIDPDIFAVGDVWELLSRDMHGKAIMCRRRAGPKGVIDRCLASSVMLLDNSRLRHWNVKEKFEKMFSFEQDYQPWICLKDEPRETIGLIENEWNDFDKLDDNTKMIHNTRRRTQPWKAGLPIDWRPAENFRLFPPLGWLMRARRKLFGEYALLGRYKSHPDPNQERFFFGLLKECLEKGIVTDDMIRDEMAQNHVRHDAFDVVERTPRLVGAWR